MILGLGCKKACENPDVLKRAFELGIRFFDLSPSYSSGLCESSFATALQQSGIDRSEIIISTKTHFRDPEDALTLLDNSLAELKTDYIDIWHLQCLSTKWDLAVYSALIKAKQDGRVKKIGVSCNENAELLKTVIERCDFDYVMMPLNIADKHRDSFINTVLPIVGTTKVIAMQVLFMGGKNYYPILEYLQKEIKSIEHRCPVDNTVLILSRKVIGDYNWQTPTSGKWSCPRCDYVGDEIHDAYSFVKECIDYVASLPIDVMLLGCSEVYQLEQDVALFNSKTILTTEQQQIIEDKTEKYKYGLNCHKKEKD